MFVDINCRYFYNEKIYILFLYLYLKKYIYGYFWISVNLLICEMGYIGFIYEINLWF